MVPFAKREPQAGGAADERQIESGTETDVLQAENADPDRGNADDIPPSRRTR